MAVLVCLLSNGGIVTKIGAAALVADLAKVDLNEQILYENKPLTSLDIDAPHSFAGDGDCGRCWRADHSDAAGHGRRSQT